jgi:hypothetical protein
MHVNHTADLVLEQLPSGAHAWLRPAAATQLDRYQRNPDRVVIVDQVDANRSPDDEEPRYWITDQGRRDLAMARAFGKGSTVAEARKGGEQPI